MIDQVAKTSDVQTYKRLARYLRSRAWYFVAAIVGYVVAALAEVVFAQTLGAVVDTFQPVVSEGTEETQQGINWIPPFVATLGISYVIVFPALIFGVAIFRAVGTVAGEFLLSRVSFHVVHTVRCELFDHLLVLPSAYFDRNKLGTISNRLTDTASKLRDTVTDVLKISIQDGGKLIVLLGALIAINFWLTVVFLVIAPIVGGVVRFASKRFRRISQRIQESMGEVTQVGQEGVSAYKLIRAFGGEDQERQRFREASEANRKQNLKMVATKASSTQFIQLVVALALGVLVGVLFVPTVSGGMSTGDLVTYIGIAGLLASPIKRLSDLNSRVQTGLAAADEIFAQIDHAPEEDSGTHVVDRARGEVEFSHIHFHYRSDAEVLTDFSLKINAGEKVAIVGTTGSGKSTLMELLMRYYEPQQGEILLDGVPIAEYSKDNLRRQLAMVSQDVFLFNDTLRANIAYGSLAESTEERIEEALEKARVNPFLSRLPDGLATIVGDRGLNLSQGQRQRIAIARAFLKDAPVVILDEATSSLDTETEKMLQEVINEALKDRTMIVIAHRLSTVERADRIVVLEEGRIVESGTHTELMAINGRYSVLHNSPSVATVETVERKTQVLREKPASYRDAPRNFIENMWYSKSKWANALRPAAALFGGLVGSRKKKFVSGKKQPWRAPVPVVIVGNIVVGGTGKTPLVIWLANWLSERGKKVGIVSRGYGGKASYPLTVDIETSVLVAGDEAPLIVERTGCPVVVDPDRTRACQHLLENFQVDIILSDDGLQHYDLARDIEIVVMDGERGFGNGLMLPAGPLREPPSRLKEVDWIVSNGQCIISDVTCSVMWVVPTVLVNATTKKEYSPEQFIEEHGNVVHAYSGIGNPQRFVSTLTDMDLRAIHHAYPDHHNYKVSDFRDVSDDIPVITTEKDWRKVSQLALNRANLWYLRIDIEFDEPVDEHLEALFKTHGVVLS